MAHTHMNQAERATGGFQHCLQSGHGAVDTIGTVVNQVLCMPFDTARALHAAAARAGLIQKSMLECRDFEISLMSLERLTLGPWARRV